MGSWEETVTDMSTERDRDARRACVWDITGQAWELEKSDGGGVAIRKSDGLFSRERNWKSPQTRGQETRWRDRVTGIAAVGQSKDGHTRSRDALGSHPPSAIRAPSWQEREH